MGGKIVTKWREIAGYANLDVGEVENVDRNNVKYLEPKEKASQILAMISNKHNFSRKELGSHLNEAKLCNLVDLVLKGTLRHPPDDDAGSSITSPNESIES